VLCRLFGAENMGQRTQSINHNQSIINSIIQSINQSFAQSINQSFAQSIYNQSLTQPMVKTTNAVLSRFCCGFEAPLCAASAASSIMM
jgi:hypothetical protein